MQSRFGTTFYNCLKGRLGEIDASSECLELAMREFLAASTLAASPTMFIQELSLKHGVRVDVFDVPLFVRRGSALRIIGIIHAFEALLDKMIASHPKVINRKGRKDEETLLDFIV